MGGGFDPPHMFHVAIAERAREFLGLDIVVFLPADSSPPKFGSHAAPFADRVEMLKIALRNFSGPFEICDAEARAEGVFYAADAARILAEKFSGARLYWIMGSDRAAGLHIDNPSALYELYRIFIAPFATKSKFKHAVKHRARLVKLARCCESFR